MALQSEGLPLSPVNGGVQAKPARRLEWTTLGRPPVLSDTVILSSPTTTEHDRTVVEYLERVLAIDATGFGREMFEKISDMSRLPAEAILSRDAKEYEAAGVKTICIAQVETVGSSLVERKDELLAALSAAREAKGLLAVRADDHRHPQQGHRAACRRRFRCRRAPFGGPTTDGVVSLPGVMSRKKQVAPKLLEAAAR